MTVFVVDTGVLLKALLPEDGTPDAMALLEAAAEGEVRLAAPEFGALEFANVLWKAELRGHLSRRRVEEAVEDLPAWAVAWAPSLPLLSLLGAPLSPGRRVGACTTGRSWPWRRSSGPDS